MNRFGSFATLCLILGTGLLLATSSPAHAYRTGADLPELPDGASVHWHGPIVLSVHRSGLLDQDAAALGDALVRAAATWQLPACAAITFRVEETTDAAAEPGDGKSVVERVDSGWEERGLDPALPGATLVQYENVDGGWRITEADVFLNAEHFDLSFVLPTDSSAVWLDAVLTHELGHVLGLLHICESDGADGAPLCEDVATEGATMSPEYDPDQVMLDDDAIAGLCFLYPRPANGSMQCVSDDCSDADGGASTDGGADPAVKPSSDAGQLACDGGASGEPCDGSTCAPEPCNGGGLEVGERCSEADDCQTGRCLTGAGNSSVCTRACGVDQPACPHGWNCFAVANENVCVPPDDSGCSVRRVPGTRSGALPPSILGMGACALVSLMRSRRRRVMRVPSQG